MQGVLAPEVVEAILDGRHDPERVALAPVGAVLGGVGGAA
jgi:hypothetical protein